HVLRPLIGFREQGLAGSISVELLPQPFKYRMRLGQILVVRSFALAKVGHRVETESVHSGIEPTLHHPQDRRHYAGIIEIQVRLVREEAMPVISAGFLVPCPVRFLGIGENNAGAGIFLVAAAPDIPVAGTRSGRAALGSLEPSVMTRRSRRLASCMNRRKSFMVPKDPLMSP